MKISFEGSMEEFQALFYGFDLEEDEDGNIVPTGRGRLQMLKGGREETEEVDLGDEGEEDEDEDERKELTVAPNPPEAPVLPHITDEDRTAAWRAFRDAVAAWAGNFGETEEVEVEVPVALRNEDGKPVNEDGRVLNKGERCSYRMEKTIEVRPKEPQPDRQELLRALGTGPHVRPILIMAYEIGSLQRLVERALLEGGVNDLDLADRIAANMVQVSHKVFPDLAGTYDYSTRWKRITP